MITLEICEKQPFDITAITPRGTLGLCCVHISSIDIEVIRTVFNFIFFTKKILSV